MDNQHPSPEKGKVQRSSRKRVLDNIVWETPRIINNTYVYLLKSTKDHVTRYVGITSNPEQRYVQHTTLKIRQQGVIRNSHKENWTRCVFKDGFDVIMTIIESHSSIEEALKREEFLINSLDNLVNSELSPTTPNRKVYYVHYLYENRTEKFDSCVAACAHLNVSYMYSNVTVGKYVITTESDYCKAVDPICTLKAIDENGVIIKATDQKHMAFLIGCSKNMVNLCIMKQRRQAKGWTIARINEEFVFKDNDHYTKVVCVNDGKIYNTALEAARYYNADPSTVTKVCKQTRKQVKGYVFKYYDDMIQPQVKA